jgi:hypothetical protein
VAASSALRFSSPQKDIAGPLPHPVLFLLVWILGAGISLLGCNAFAELGSMFP